MKRSSNIVTGQLRNIQITIASQSNPEDFTNVIVSSDSKGTPGELNKIVLDRLGIVDVWEKVQDNKNLESDGFLWISEIKSSVASRGYINLGVVVTISDLQPTQALYTNLLKCLRRQTQIFLNETIWLPLLGTGDAEIEKMKSLETSLMAVRDTFVNNPDPNLNPEIVISTNNEFNVEEYPEIEDVFHRIISHIGEESEDLNKIIQRIEESGQQNHWWMNASTKQWTIDDLTTIGEDFHYSTHNQKKKKRRIFENFFNAKQGDLVIAYQTAPELKVKALLEVIEPAKNKDFDNIRFKVLYKFVQQPTWNTLKQNDLFQSSQVGRNPQGSFFELNFEEFVEVINLTELGPINISKPVADELKTPGYSNDDPKVKTDLLGVENDVRAFATLMALRETQAPIAIALFGNWGTGKSFFMNKLHDHIADLAKLQGFKTRGDKKESSETSDKKPYCEGIAQIFFNAWSYMDANLMASMVSEVFEKLLEFISKDKKGALEKHKIEQELTGKLSLAKEQQSNINYQKKENEAALDQINEKLKKAKEDVKKKTAEIEKGIYKKVYDKVNSEFKLEENIKKALNNNIKNVNELKKLEPEGVLKELKSVRTFIQQMLNFKLGDIIFVLLSVVLIAVVILLPFFATGLDSLDLKIPQGLLTLLAPLPVVWRKFITAFNTISPVITKVMEVKKDYDHEIQKAKSDFEQEEKAAKIEISQIELDIESLNIKQIEIQKAIANLDFALKNTLAQRALYSFIADRSRSEDYAKNLGIISTIRKDFEILSNLFDESKKESLKFRENFETPLERIILYIDDLDRCPDNKVMEVLQAVHLLMAFPLFIVVVGVDKRCVYNALLYKNLLQYSQYTESHKPEDIEEYGIKLIRPQEYLEKIFQIPFHLKEVEENAVKNMIGKLLEGQIEFKEETQARSIQDKKLSETAKALDSEKKEQRMELEAKGTKKPGSEQKEETDKEPLKEEIEKVIVFTPEDLKITEQEYNYLKEMAWLIGSTPRTIKRYINIYRLIRARELSKILGDDPQQDYLIIMFILGLTIGKNRKDNNRIMEGCKNNPDLNLENILNDPDILYGPEVIMKLNETGSLQELLNIKGERINKYLSFVRRFTFGQESDIYLNNNDSK